MSGSERTLRGFLAYCLETLREPALAPSPVTQALVEAEKRRAQGLAPRVVSALESHRAAVGSLQAYMDWCSTLATVAADVERALADVAEEECAALGVVAELDLGGGGGAEAQAAAAAAEGGGSGGGGGGFAEAAGALAGPCRASAARLSAYGAELHALHCTLIGLLQASLDSGTAALLERAEDYSGEAKGVRELLCVDAYGVSPDTAEASPAAVRVAPSPFVRPRPAGEIIIWCSLTGQRVNRNPKPFTGPFIEAEFQKGCLGIQANVAVRINSVVTALEAVPPLLGPRGEVMGSASGGAGGGGAGGARQRARPKSAPRGAAPPPAAAAAAAAEEGKEGEGKEGEGKEGEGKAEEGKEGEGGGGAGAGVAGSKAAPPPPAAAAAPSPLATTTTPAAAIPLRPVGGWISLDQLSMPAPNFGIRGWAMTPTAPPPPTASASASASASALSASPLLRLEHPAVTNASAASTTNVKVRWHLPHHVVTGPAEGVCPRGGSIGSSSSSSGSSSSPNPFPRALLPGRWVGERGEWTVEGVVDPSFTPATRTLQFGALNFAPHALLQPIAVDFPYASWALSPAPVATGAGAGAGRGGHAALLDITTARGIRVRMHVCAQGCTLLGPRLPALAFLTLGASSSSSSPAAAAAAASTGSGSGSGGAEAAAPLPPTASAGGGAPLDGAGGGGGGGGGGGEGEGGGEPFSHPQRGAPCLPPGQMLAALRACGVHLSPRDVDAPATAAILAAEGRGVQLPPLLPPPVEAALYADLAYASASFALRSVAGRGYGAGVPPPDPSDAPPNSHARMLAQVRALETLEPLGAGHTGRGALAWREDPTATLRVSVREDGGLPRGCLVFAEPEGRGAGARVGGGATYATVEACLLAAASPEALAWLTSAPPTFTEMVRRLLCLCRPLNFQQ